MPDMYAHIVAAGTVVAPAGGCTRGRSGNFTRYFSPASQNCADGSPVVGTRSGGAEEEFVDVAGAGAEMLDV
jgi:hypothetical protein